MTDTEAYARAALERIRDAGERRPGATGGTYTGSAAIADEALRELRRMDRRAKQAEVARP